MTLKSQLEIIKKSRRVLDTSKIFYEGEDFYSAIGVLYFFFKNFDGFKNNEADKNYCEDKKFVENFIRGSESNAKEDDLEKITHSLILRIEAYLEEGETQLAGSSTFALDFQNFWNELKFGNLSSYRKYLLPLIVSLCFVAIFWGVVSHKKKVHSLRAEYFSDMNLGKSFKVKFDPIIDFSWPDGMGPVQGIGADNFSVRWTGFLEITQKGIYEFLVTSDDGVSFWVGGKNIIHRWNDHSATLDKSKVTLDVGYYPVRLEYYENKADGIIQLKWQSEYLYNVQNINHAFLYSSQDYLDKNIPILYLHE